MRELKSEEARGAAETPATIESAAPAEAVDAKRREAMALLAKWTPPAMMTLMLSTRANAFSLPPPPPT